MKTTSGAGNQQPEYGSSEIIVINNRKDVFTYAVPLDGTVPTSLMKRFAAQGLANLIVDKIEPEFYEMTGYEVMKYTVVIKKYDTKNIKK